MYMREKRVNCAKYSSFIQLVIRMKHDLVTVENVRYHYGEKENTKSTHFAHAIF